MNVMVKKEWIEKGYVDEPIDETLDLKAEIRKLCKEKDAIILAHYYTVGEIQDIADFVGDSLALARKAAETEAKVMVMCGTEPDLCERPGMGGAGGKNCGRMAPGRPGRHLHENIGVHVRYVRCLYG